MAAESKSGIGAVVDVIAGMAAGMTAKIVEYPFDTMKVRLQTQGTGDIPMLYTGTMDCARKIYASEGFFRGFYTGLLAPFLGSALENATLLAFYGQTCRLMREYNDRNFGPDEAALSVPQMVGASCIAGFAVAAVLTPVELIKCRLQVQRARKPDSAFAGVHYNGPVDCVRKVFREGGLSLLYRGHTLTMYREIPGSVMYFGGYEGTRYLFSQWLGTPVEELGSLPVMLSGAIAGVGYWTWGMPADTIKSIIQIELSSGRKSLLDVGRMVVRNYGFRGLYRGYVPTVLRALPSNAVLFLTFNVVQKVLNTFVE